MYGLLGSHINWFFTDFFIFIGFEFGYNYSWFLNKWGFVEGGLVGFRVNSILSEPTYLAIALAPAIYVSYKISYPSQISFLISSNPSWL